MKREYTMEDFRARRRGETSQDASVEDENIAMAKKRLGRCPVCNVYKRLTDGGLMRLHKRHEVRCAGSLQPPRLPAPPPPDDPRARLPSSRLRLRMLERDGFRCRKCGYHSPTGQSLEPHHVKEFSQGGETTLENLHTLCGMCHAELSWIWVNSPPVAYEQWLELTPVTHIVHALLIIRDDLHGLGAHAGEEMGIDREAAARLLGKKP